MTASKLVGLCNGRTVEMSYTGNEVTCKGCGVTCSSSAGFGAHVVVNFGEEGKEVPSPILDSMRAKFDIQKIKDRKCRQSLFQFAVEQLLPLEKQLVSEVLDVQHPLKGMGDISCRIPLLAHASKIWEYIPRCDKTQTITERKHVSVEVALILLSTTFTDCTKMLVSSAWLKPPKNADSNWKPTAIMRMMEKICSTGDIHDWNVLGGPGLLDDSVHGITKRLLLQTRYHTHVAQELDRITLELFPAVKDKDFHTKHMVGHLRNVSCHHMFFDYDTQPIPIEGSFKTLCAIFIEDTPNEIELSSVTIRDEIDEHPTFLRTGVNVRELFRICNAFYEKVLELVGYKISDDGLTMTKLKCKNCPGDRLALSPHCPDCTLKSCIYRTCGGCSSGRLVTGVCQNHFTCSFARCTKPTVYSTTDGLFCEDHHRACPGCQDPNNADSPYDVERIPPWASTCKFHETKCKSPIACTTKADRRFYSQCATHAKVAAINLQSVLTNLCLARGKAKWFKSSVVSCQLKNEFSAENYDLATLSPIAVHFGFVKRKRQKGEELLSAN